MEFQVDSQTTTITTRKATEMTLMFARMIPMVGDVLFEVAFLISLERAVSTVKTGIFLLCYERLGRRSREWMYQLDVCDQAFVVPCFVVAIPTILVTLSSTAEIVPLFRAVLNSWSRLEIKVKGG